MEQIKGNKLGFKTFKYLKVNDTEINLPDIDIKEYRIDSDPVEALENKDFGVCQEALDMNEKSGNLFKKYRTEENQVKDFGVVDLVTDREYDILLDTHKITAEKNSSLRVVLDYRDNDDNKKFRSSVIEINAKENSNVEVFVIQTEKHTTALESLILNLDEESNVILSQYELGSRDNYVNTKANLNGKHSNLDINSIYFTHGDNSLNMLYEINHFGKESKSSCIVNGALKESSYKNFKSTLDFKKGSMGSTGTEEEYAVLLSDDVKNLSVPVLLAGEDDVLGNHAASAGKIDADMLFYIMNRAISRDVAESMIVESKFSESLSRLDDEKLENKLLSFIREKMAKRELDVR
ncbi:SufD family Fe-S cluster assembly protein [uncultured Finegoldia sp.]|uniref:SufB/SufD family protein n=1 Tax=uncultured Finegoldia sp. TaxID=328009 RepID=UPI0025D5B5F4|nr:SufD family Fe-S cluster assembly protein [uncultured Finegoldia sp.]